MVDRAKLADRASCGSCHCACGTTVVRPLAERPLYQPVVVVHDRFEACNDQLLRRLGLRTIPCNLPSASQSFQVSAGDSCNFKKMTLTAVEYCNSSHTDDKIKRGPVAVTQGDVAFFIGPIHSIDRYRLTEPCVGLSVCVKLGF